MGQWGPDRRSRWCAACGEASDAPALGGAFTCSHCEHEAALASPATPASSGPGRTAEATHTLEENRRYRFKVPEGLKDLTQGEDLAARMKAALLVRIAAIQNEAAADDQRDAEDTAGTRGQAIYWLAVSFRMAVQDDAPAEAFLALSTARDTLDDVGYRHLLASNLAGFARHRGALDDAASWLQRTEPAPESLELDSDARGERALLRLAEDQPESALAEVGAPGSEARCEGASEVRFGMIRVTALERLGRRDEAELCLHTLLSHPDVTGVRLRRWLGRTREFHPARTTWARVDPEGATGLGAPRPLSTWIGVGLFVIGGLAMTGLGVAGELQLRADSAWVAVPAEVLSSRGERYEYDYPGANGATRVGVGLAVHARYRYGEPSRESDVYSLDDAVQRFGQREVDAGRSQLAALESGARIEVYVSPDAAQVVRVRRESDPRRGVLVGGLGMMLVALALFGLSRRRKRRFQTALDSLLG